LAGLDGAEVPGKAFGTFVSQRTRKLNYRSYLVLAPFQKSAINLHLKSVQLSPELKITEHNDQACQQRLFSVPFIDFLIIFHARHESTLRTLSQLQPGVGGLIRYLFETSVGELSQEVIGELR